MAKPILLTLDDDPDVLRAVARDLRREYGAQYRVLRADWGDVAIKALQELKLSADPVALLLVDQRMPGLTGVECLEQAIPLFPDAKRVLLTAYADTDAAIRAINSVKIDHYLLKPWDPPEEHLYPVLSDLLDEWHAHYTPPFEGIRVIGHRWSPATHAARDFLSRNQFPYQWLDLDGDPEARRILESANGDVHDFPLVVFPDGSRMQNPSNREIAEKVGLQTRAETDFYDLIVVGAGPSGLAAGVYGASEGLRTLIIEREAPGGQAGMSSRIENYLGFPVGLSGGDLARRAVTQARRLGAEILTPQEVVEVRLKDSYRVVELSDGNELNCHALLVATGVEYRKLDVPGIDLLTGAGVYYGAALTEGESVRGEDVFIVGGANSAGQAAVYFAEYARTVHMLVRGDDVRARMSEYLVERIEATPIIQIRLKCTVAEVRGEERLESVGINEGGSNGHTEMFPASALFILIGASPRTEWLGESIARDEHGFLLSGYDLSGEDRPSGWRLARDPFLLETSLPGIFVAGDVRAGSMKRVASAVGEGAMVVAFIHRYLAEVHV